jgi:RNase P subunit RPR2
MDKNTKEDKFDLKHIKHICKKCDKIMRFHSADEVGDMFFVEYICPKCDAVIWILDREKQYMSELSEYVIENVL